MDETIVSGATPQTILTRQTLIIESVEVPIEHRSMPLKDVLLDPSNPRIQHAVRQFSKSGGITQDDLRKIILGRPGVEDLFKAIRDNGGIQEPIYVRPDGRIIEGNCRAASYLRLYDIDTKNGIDPKKSRWAKIPAVFVPQISDRQVAILQGQYHVAGKNKWQAYEKAGHLHHMHTHLHMDEKTIARALGMREHDVIRDLKAYDIMTQKLLPKMKNGNGLEKWSFVQEFYKRKDLVDYRAKNVNVDSFVSLVAQDKIKRGTDVRKLAKILEHPKAVEVLKKQDVDTAMTVVGKADPTAASSVFRRLKQTTRLLQRIQKPDLDRLRENEKSQIILRELFSAVKEAAKAAAVKLP